MAGTRYPNELPTDLGGLPTLVQNLSRSFLDAAPEPFGVPDDLLKVARKLEARRLAGVGRHEGRVARSLPAVILGGLASQRTPFLFGVRAEARRITVFLGGDPPMTLGLCQSVRSVLGGPEPGTASVLGDLPPWRGCLTGWPRIASADGIGRPDASPLDVALDAVGESRFVYLVYATPEPAENVCGQLDRWRTAAQEVDRVHLRPGGGGDTNRTAKRARDLLDRLCARYEVGGLFRCTALVAADDERTLRFTAALLSGGLRADPQHAVAPMRVGSCSAGGAYAVHQDVLSAPEVAGLCVLPQRDRNGFSLQLEASFDVDCTPLAPAEDVARLADILDGSVPSGATFHVPLRTLCRHALVAGMTGSGKSTTVRALLAELGRRRVPFLVLEPAKAEYHRLADVVDGLLVFRLGAAPRESEVLFQLNPFYFPDGFPLHTHIDFLKQAMVTSFGLHPPAPYLLETALHRVYERRGWDLGTGNHPQGRHSLAFPTLSDLLDEVGPVVDAAGYDREVTRNLKGALKTRIGNLCIGAKGAMLDTRENLPDDLLFGAPVVLELKDLGSDEEKALVMGLVLTRLYEVRERGGALPEEKLRHLLVIEEAHRLLRRTADRSAEEGDMQGQAVQTFANILSEVRAFGQGVMVVEQLPGKLAPDVVKNTSLKVIHRMAPRDDRDAVGDAMNLDEPQKRFLTVLPQGEAVIHTEGMDGAIRVRVRPVVLAARAATVHASDSTRGRLPADLVTRLDRGARRLRLSQGLDHAEVKRAADGVVLEVGHGSAATAARTTLNATLTRAFSVAGPGRPAEQIREAAAFAIEEALRRLALRHHFTSSAFEKAVSAGTHMGTVLPGLLDRIDGPLPHCAACPAKCRSLYFAERLAADPELRQSLRAVLDAPPTDLPTSLAEKVRPRARRIFLSDADPPMGLSYCTLGLALEHLGFARSATQALLKRLIDRKPHA